MTAKKDWTKTAQLILTLVIALTGVGASWGASKVEASNLKSQIESVQMDVKQAQTDVGNLRTNGAVTQNELKNINQRLGEIQGQLIELGKKIDQLKR